ncbi:hypothetical protein BKA93DRAFT_457476 [Sparassis latifolia]|uniref:Uncharacterized protein n=1 Tax=Sparassis crispa TaxID=139825 RepID=A0A401H6T7_9APHY|nr:hypothetical protein SCP_1801230 [Sparassis crispa]GBE90099.1 hypothetical protein SCP_1801230 [Sparassis crispa]
MPLVASHITPNMTVTLPVHSSRFRFHHSPAKTSIKGIASTPRPLFGVATTSTAIPGYDSKAVTGCKRKAVLDDHWEYEQAAQKRQKVEQEVKDLTAADLTPYFEVSSRIIARSSDASASTQDATQVGKCVWPPMNAEHPMAATQDYVPLEIYGKRHMREGLARDFPGAYAMESTHLPPTELPIEEYPSSIPLELDDLMDECEDDQFPEVEAFFQDACEDVQSSEVEEFLRDACEDVQSSEVEDFFWDACADVQYAEEDFLSDACEDIQPSPLASPEVEQVTSESPTQQKHWKRDNCSLWKKACRTRVKTMIKIFGQASVCEAAVSEASAASCMQHICSHRWEEMDSVCSDDSGYESDVEDNKGSVANNGSVAPRYLPCTEFDSLRDRAAACGRLPPLLAIPCRLFEYADVILHGTPTRTPEWARGNLVEEKKKRDERKKEILANALASFTP